MQQMRYMKWNTSVLFINVTVAVAVKSYFTNDNALSFIFSTFCLPSDADSWIVNLMHSMAWAEILGWSLNGIFDSLGGSLCTVSCYIKILAFAVVLLFCHRFIHPIFSYAIFLIFLWRFIDFKNLLLTGVIILVLNMILSILMGQHMNKNGKQKAPCDAAIYYEDCVFYYKVVLSVVALLVGCGLSLL